MIRTSIARTLTPLLALALLGSAAPAMADKYYKWVDDNGVTHYGAAPPEDGGSEAVRTYGPSSDQGKEIKALQEQREAAARAREQAEERARQAAQTRKMNPDEKAAYKKRKAREQLIARRGVDPDHDWQARYEILPGKEKVVSELKRQGNGPASQSQGKIHSQIVAANDGYLYFSSFDEAGETDVRLPDYGGHLWRLNTQSGQWEHLLATPEALIAVNTDGPY